MRAVLCALQLGRMLLGRQQRARSLLGAARLQSRIGAERSRTPAQRMQGRSRTPAKEKTRATAERETVLLGFHSGQTL